jgi:methyltransferase (TIGR00027 family)
MLDAQSPDSLLHDTWAERFMDADGLAFFEQFRTAVIPNRSNAVRHHIIDEILRHRLAADPKRRIVLLGAGFDMRAFRLAGGEWFEVDEAPIVDRKNAIAPASDAPNPLTRIAVDFARDSLADALDAVATDQPMTVVIEGVLYYLDRDAIARTLTVLTQRFPRHELVCDLQSQAFVARYGGQVIRKIQEHGAAWRFAPADPVHEIETRGYTLRSATSVPLTAAAMKRISIPAWVVRWFLGSLRDGYRVCVFNPAPVA